jgi:hypothetical protein
MQIINNHFYHSPLPQFSSRSSVHDHLNRFKQQSFFSLELNSTLYKFLAAYQADDSLAQELLLELGNSIVEKANQKHLQHPAFLGQLLQQLGTGNIETARDNRAFLKRSGETIGFPPVMTNLDSQDMLLSAGFEGFNTLVLNFVDKQLEK